MTDPLVTVVIPAYNRREFIAETVQSVLAQGYSPVELLVVDDGSSDGTYELLLNLAQEHGFRVLTHEGRANRGQSAAINLGLAAAKGKYIAILDSDDLFANGKLYEQVAFLEDNQDIGMVYGNGQAIDVEGRPLFRTLPPTHVEGSDPNRLLLNCYVALPGAALVRAEVYTKAGVFEEGFRAAQDHDMALRIMEVTRVAYLPNIAFYYRKHGGSISTNGLRRRWETGFEILRRAERRWPYKRSTIRKRLAVVNFRMGQAVWREGSHVKAMPYLIKSALLDPFRALSVLSGSEKI